MVAMVLKRMAVENMRTKKKKKLAASPAEEQGYLIVEKMGDEEKVATTKKLAALPLEGQVRPPIATSNALPSVEPPDHRQSKLGGEENVALSGSVTDEKPSTPDVPQSRQSKKKNKKKRNMLGVDSQVLPPIDTGEQLKKTMIKRKKKKRKVDVTANPTLGGMEMSSAVEGAQNVSSHVPEPVGMQIYWNLSSVEASVREAASVALVRELIEAQSEFDDLGLGGEEKAAEAVILGEAKTEADGLKNCSPAVKYAVRRLIRGVASSRESARQGFALALAAVLGALHCIRGTDLVSMIRKHLEVSPSMKGQETRDALLGQLFAYGALIQSYQRRGMESTFEQQQLLKEVTECLLALAKKKTFLREPAIFLLVQLGEQLEASGFHKSICASTAFLDAFKEEPTTISPDILFLALRLHQKLPNSILQSCSLIPKSGNLVDIFEEDQLLRLVPCLMESSCSHPRVHSVWHPLMDILFSKTELSKKGKKRKGAEELSLEMRLKTFWTIIADGALLSSSHERKNLAMQLVLLLLPRLPDPSYIKYILSQRFVQCLLGASASKGNLLYKSAYNCIAGVCKWAEEDEQRRISVAISLQQSSQGKFDHLSRTQSVKGLLGGLSTISGYQSTFQAFTRLFSAGTPETDAVVATSLNSKRQKIPAGDVGVEAGNVVSRDGGKQRWAVDQLRMLCQQALVGLPANIAIQELIAKFLPSVAPLQPFTDDEEESVAILQSTMLQLSVAISNIETGEKKERLQAMLSLLVQLLFESRLVPSVAVETASEITVCCKKAFGDLVDLDIDFDGEGVDSPVFMDVLVDVLLSLLAQSSAPIRAAADQVFKSFSGDLTSSGLTDLLRIVKKNTQRSRHKPVVEVESEDDEEILDMEDNADEFNDEQDDESGSDNDVDSSDHDQGSAGADKLPSKVKLPSKRKQDKSDDEEEESEASDLDDETMFRMDKHLSNILKQRKQGGDGAEDSKDTQTQLMHFKFRVLALLEFFLQKHGGSMLVLTMLPSLLHVFVNSCTTDGNSEVADRVSSILQNKLFKGKLYPKGPEVDQSGLKDLLKKALKLASRSTTKRVALLAQATCHWILKVIRGNLDKENDEDVERVFSAALEDFFVHKKCRLPLSFFQKCFTQNSWLGNCLLGVLLEKSVNARSEFLQFESLHLIGTILRFKSGKVSNKLKHLSSDQVCQAESLKRHLSALRKLIDHLLKAAPSAKAVRRIEALQFCTAALELHQSLCPDSRAEELINFEDLAVTLKAITAPPNSKLSKLVFKLQQIGGK